MHTSRHPISILFEDNHLLVVEKPVNMPTQEDSSGDLDLLTALKADLKERFNKPGNVYLGLVHRLDRPVGGVMVFAKTSKAASRLSNEIRLRSFRKTYVAVVHGIPTQTKGKLIHCLVKDEKANKVHCVDQHHPEAKQAVLDYNVLDTRNNLSFIRVQLHTGRPHQIRVQFQQIGCPLFGDQKYGAELNSPGQQIALWSMYIGFEHPTLKESLQFTSNPYETDSYPWTLWSHDFYQHVLSNPGGIL
jgi:23S rRNA pseudouridine1911/1915/1917 synthase